MDIAKAIFAITTYLQEQQNIICTALAEEDGTQSFVSDTWSHDHGGGGITCILTGGSVIEKAGVNFSHIHGNRLPLSATGRHPDLSGRSYQAMGLSLVVHPMNPYAPISHANVRFFIAEKEDAPPIWWFGGGFDLTPCYGFESDCRHWHQVARSACQPFGAGIYPEFKKACDDYFFIKHRNEPRGIGGLFFDDFHRWDFEHCFALMRSVADHYLPAYRPILNKRKALPYGDREKAFQCYRRGRYVEFNLIYDRGTAFGLASHGRVESILMSLPPMVRWIYNFQPEPDSPESRLNTQFLVHRSWI